MEEIFVEAVRDEASGIDLQYVTLSTADTRQSDKALSKVYSLLVIKGDPECGDETAFVYDVSRSRERALRIARVMRENTVTPCAVGEVLDDIL